MDKHLYHVVLQYCRTLIFTKNNFISTRTKRCFVLLQTFSVWSFQGNRCSIITPKYIYENTCLIFSLWITIGTLCEPNTILSVFLVLISRALLSLYLTTLFTPCWCSPGLPEILELYHQNTSQCVDLVYL